MAWGYNPFTKKLDKTLSDAEVTDLVSDSYLKLDQTTPQTVINGAPIFGVGLKLTAGQDIRPTADSTTAINIAQADGTDFVTFDTTNKKTTFGGNVTLSPGSLGSELAPSLAAANWTLGTGWHTGYYFVISASITTAPAVGDTYTNNSVTFTILAVNVVSGSSYATGSITCSGTSAPAASGNLTRTSGAGDATIAFTSVVSTGLFKDLAGTGTAAPSTAITPVAGTSYKLVITFGNWSVVTGTGAKTMTISLGGTTLTRVVSSSETITEYIKATNTNNLIFTPTTLARMNITAVSVKAIGSTGLILPSASGVNSLMFADNSGFPTAFYDTTNNRWGFGHPAPAVPYEFQSKSEGSQTDVIALTNWGTTVGSGVGIRFKSGNFGGGSIAKLLGFITNIDAPNSGGTAWGNSAIVFQTRLNGSISTRFYCGPAGDTRFGVVTNSPPLPQKISQLTIQVVDDATITGTTTVNASTTVTGSGTDFLYELGIGDRISVSSASTTYSVVTAIASATSLTVDVALGDGTSQTIKRKKSLFRLDGAYTPTGGTENVPKALFFVDDLGKVKIANGVNPTAFIHLPAGTNVAGTAPLKFTSGTLLTAAEAGAVEFLTDDFYATQTTSTIRKKFLFNIGKITTVTTTYTILADDETVIGNSTTAFTITLPTAVVGQKFTIKNINTGTVTVDGASTDLIDGSLTQSLITWESMQLQCYVANNWGVL